MDITIIGSGCYIPEVRILNEHFENHEFLDEKDNTLNLPTIDVVKKLSCITGIQERRYAPSDYVTSDLAFIAGQTTRLYYCRA